MSLRRVLGLQWHVPAAAAFLVTAWLCVGTTPAAARQQRGHLAVSAGSVAELRQWDQRISRMERDGELRLRLSREDAFMADREHERLDQYHRGVRVFGADVTQQLDRGQLVSVYGNLHQGIDLETSPEIPSERARAIVESREGVELAPGRQPELVILPLDEGGYALAWRIRGTIRHGGRQYFIDARTGAVLLDYPDIKTQTVGRGRGVLGDSKKLSITARAGRFEADDALRPPSLKTYDMKGDYLRTIGYLDGLFDLEPNDVAIDTDNNWDGALQGAIVDAHVYTGWTYDYLFKRFNRRGLDDRDIAITSLVHPVRRNEVDALYDEYDIFFTNAAYFGDGIMVYGVGLPPNYTAGQKTWDYTSGALDIVAHELTHGVTEYTSNLTYRNESGALNEAFSDILAAGAEFFFQQASGGLQQADYLIGEDVVRPGGLRSMADPLAYGDPDHYSIRYVGPLDNGGVHSNSGIANQAFYLAIEGGTNRTSELSVQGVGGSNREQIERAFFRAFTQMLPESATFATARATTIQSARDLYGATSPAERAIREAWTAVGVE